MKLGVSIGQPGDLLAEIREIAVLADGVGLDLVGVPDTHTICREVYVSGAVVAQATSRALIGPMVTNPVTRHPSVTASAALALNELSGGRAFVGVGAGESSVANAGLEPAGTAQLEAAVEELRAGMRELGERYRGRPAGAPLPPLFVAARGPRTIAAAARCADVVLLDLGKDPELVGSAVELARRERADSARADEPFEVWILGKGYVSDDPQKAHAAVGAIMAASAVGLQSAFDFKQVPKPLRGRLRDFRERYQYSRHAAARDAAGGNAELLASSGLEDFVYERFALIGSSAEVAAQLRALERVGVAGVTFTGAVPDKRELITRLGREVAPTLNPAPTSDPAVA
jgi:5,10-methylenetetrahydromethanopterin reductase